MPIFGQKTSILLKLHYFMVIKVNRMPFLFRFFTKISLLSCQYLSKIRLFSKKHSALMPILVKKKRPLSQKHSALMWFFFNFSWKTPAVVHMIGQKTSILSKLHSILVKKSHRGCPFFSISHEKITALMSIFCPKNVHSLKGNSSHLHVTKKKTSTPLKTQFFHVFFLLFIFHKLPILSCRYFVKKRQFCQNYNTWWTIKVHKMPFFF